MELSHDIQNQNLTFNSWLKIEKRKEKKKKKILSATAFGKSKC